jgi:hypothetical protein
MDGVLDINSVFNLQFSKPIQHVMDLKLELQIACGHLNNKYWTKRSIVSYQGHIKMFRL